MAGPRGVSVFTFFRFHQTVSRGLKHTFWMNSLRKCDRGGSSQSDRLRLCPVGSVGPSEELQQEGLLGEQRSFLTTAFCCFKGHGPTDSIAAGTNSRKQSVVGIRTREGCCCGHFVRSHMRGLACTKEAPEDLKLASPHSLGLLGNN